MKFEPQREPDDWSWLNELTGGGYLVGAVAACVVAAVLGLVMLAWWCSLANLAATAPI